MKNTHNYRRKIKRKKTIKSKSEYTEEYNEVAAGSE